MFLRLTGVGNCMVLVSAAEFSLTKSHAKCYFLQFAVSVTDVEWELWINEIKL